MEDNKIVEVKHKYDDGCTTDCLTEKQYKINIPDDMEPPIYFYYQLENFFQNHRIYLQSKDDEQLSGVYKPREKLDKCSPAITNEEMELTANLENMALMPDDPAVPCGLIAKTFFNGEIYLDIKEM